jgi:penicillin amidase
MTVKPAVKKILWGVAVLLLLSVLGVYMLLRASLPKLDGEQALPGLSKPAVIARDGNGTVTITADNPTDSARALGFVHAQERYFEMDLLRRSASGELSALFGKIAIEKDKSIRVHRLRARIRQHYAQMTGKDSAMLQAYAEGVNAGLNALAAKPWPYLLLNTAPEPWQPEDTFLVGYAMFFDLQDEDNEREYKLWQLKNLLPAPIYTMLTQTRSGWDAPLFGTPALTVSIPSAEQINLNAYEAPQLAFQPNKLAEAVGSNNFAVAGALTADGRAIVADDMHLGLRAPNIWFRARLLTGTDSDVSGFTLPGIPSVIVGSNRHVAWGFTNSYGDWADFIRVHWLDAAQTRYLDGDGKPRTVQVFQEPIAVKGGEPVPFEVRETVWGPVTKELNASYALALQWAAHQPGALNLGLNELANSRDLDSALQNARTIGMPGQNLVIGDKHGRIAWRLTAQMPKRVGGCDKTAPIDPQTGCGWQGWLDGSENPVLVDPPSHRLWTANGRVVDGPWLALVGNGGYAFGARSMQIRDSLFAKQRFTERDLLAIQVDGRSLFLKRWWDLLNSRARNAVDGSAIRQLSEADSTWEATASADAVSYRLTRAWRLEVSNRIEEMLLAPAIDKLGVKSSKPGYTGFDYEAPGFTGFEDLAWALLQQQPKHLLTKNYKSWDDLLEQAARTVQDELTEQGPLKERTWGERNTANFCHPLAAALPGLVKPLLCMPKDQLQGDTDMPLVVSPTFGASERMVVSPGREEDGIIHMPGGQSGHFLSPFWGAGHNDWVEHKPTPFLPGKTAYTLTLKSK